MLTQNMAHILAAFLVGFFYAQRYFRPTKNVAQKSIQIRLILLLISVDSGFDLWPIVNRSIFWAKISTGQNLGGFEPIFG